MLFCLWGVKDKMNENWIKNGQEAVNDDDYVKLNAGLMKVSDLNDYLA